MQTPRLLTGLFLAFGLTAAPPALAQVDLEGLAKDAASAAGSAGRDKVVADVNAKLMAEGRKNQCSFKTDTDELAPGCDQKAKNLVTALVVMKKRLKLANVTSYKFEVSGHTDTRGSAEHNKALSAKRAAVMVKELVARGIDPNEIISVGMGSERPIVAHDDTPAKQARNRRYEIQLRF